MESVTVKAKSSFKHDVLITCEGQYIRWHFKLDAHDIHFSLTFHPSTPTRDHHAVTIHPDTSVHTGDALAASEYTHTSATLGTVTFVFSNAHSAFRSKQLHYQITSLPAYPIPVGVTLRTPLGPTTILASATPLSLYSCLLPYGRASLHSTYLLPYYPPTARLAHHPHESSTSINTRAMVGVYLFFTNQLDDSEHFFRSQIASHAMFAISYACVGFLRALMTWEAADMAEANRRLEACRVMVQPEVPSEGRLGGLTRLFVSAGELNNKQLEATLMTAETLILQAILLLVEENVMSFIQAGLKIRTSHRLFDRCYQEMKRRERLTAAGQPAEPIDAHVLGGIQNGMGTFSVILSLLPPIMLRLLSFFGFSSNRAEGLAMLHASSASNGLRAPLSSLVLLFLHVVIPSFFTIHMQAHNAAATALLARCFEQYPGGSFFLWLQGRQQRNNRLLSDAIVSFKRAAAGQREWRQLQHLCAYELGTTYLFMLDHDAGRPWWVMLENENQWSKAFYIYMQLITIVPDNNTAPLSSSVEAMIDRVEAACARKFGGKQLSLEQFILQRVREWRAGERPVVPVLEMIYVYHGFRCQDVPLLQRCLTIVEAELSNSPYWNTDTSTSTFDTHDHDDHSTPQLSKSKHALLLLLYASLVHHLSRPVTAARHLEWLLAHSGEVGDDFYLVPFAQFELATIHLEHLQHQLQATSASAASVSDTNQLHAAGQPDETSSAPPVTAEQVRDEYKVAAGYREKYHFKNRLHLRIHLAVTELKRLQRGEEEAGEGEGGEGVVEDDAEGLDALSDDDKKLVELAQKTEADDDLARASAGAH